MSTVKDGCRKAFQVQPQRLMAAMYSCDIVVDQKVLGELHPLIETYIIIITFFKLFKTIIILMVLNLFKGKVIVTMVAVMIWY